MRVSSFVALHGLLLSLAQTFSLSGELPPFEPMYMLMASIQAKPNPPLATAAPTKQVPGTTSGQASG